MGVSVVLGAGDGEEDEGDEEEEEGGDDALREGLLEEKSESGRPGRRDAVRLGEREE